MLLYHKKLSHMFYLTADKLPVVNTILSYAVTAVCCGVLMSVIASGVRFSTLVSIQRRLMHSMSSRFRMTGSQPKWCGQVQGSMGYLLYSIREYR
jgi:hypothetical protein